MKQAASKGWALEGDSMLSCAEQSSNLALPEQAPVHCQCGHEPATQQRSSITAAETAARRQLGGVTAARTKTE